MIALQKTIWQTIAGLCFILLQACGGQPEQAAVNDPIPQVIADSSEAFSYLENGDLITRTGQDIVSLSLRNMNDSDKTFSHSGFVFYEDSCWYVYHMIAGADNPSMEMRRDKFSFFTDRKEQAGYGIYRYQLSPLMVDSLHALIRQQYTNKLKFDTTFNLKDDATMYCSEMISKDISRVSGDSIIIPTTKKKSFFLKGKQGPQPKRDVEYVAIDNLYLNKWCMLIFRKEYK